TASPCHRVLVYDLWAQTRWGICSPISHDVSSHTWTWRCLLGGPPSLLGGAIFSMSSPLYNTQSVGQALRVSLFKPGAYLSARYAEEVWRPGVLICAPHLRCGGSAPMTWLDHLLGRPLASSEETQEQLSVLTGVPVLGLDALASTGYGPEAVLTIL